jgi:hypothetical protein
VAAQVEEVGSGAALRLADSLTALGTLLCEDERPNEAVEHLRRAVQLRTSHLPQHSWKVVEAQLELARALTDAGAVAEASKMLLELEDLPLHAPSFAEFRERRDRILAGG